ncbi:MAG: ABC transporter ATP-binding protein [Cyanobacteriota bacterium PSP.bin.10]|jgi:putative spermidine/putrescine transport system ATP-binding protein|uniref:ABC transporter ATP-binding protein n=1 Tax=unclassified Synechococcus TaxID=2626047 RepID=UPI0028CDAE8E|nr:ABC transporter ATP-binding protein [Cyanobacteriota bacterium PSP.bin.10]
MTSPASVVFDHIAYAYTPGRWVVQDICLEVQPGEIVVLVGPSGCGKSTLLRLVAGLLIPTQGRLLLDGINTSTLAPEKRLVGWVPQSYALFEHLNVRDNVAFGLRMRRVAKEAMSRRISEMLELCRIAELADRPVTQLSGGQRQRVAIARALAVSPRVLLLDEPLAALDPQLRAAIRADLQVLLRASGVTTLFVTHDQEEALAIADRVAVLQAGQVEQFGTPQQIWQSPANSFVAQFFGGATVLTARRIGPGRVRLAPGLEADVPLHCDDQVVQVAVRSGDLELLPEVSPSTEAGQFIPMTVEFAGDAFRITGELIGAGRVTLLHNRPVIPGQRYPVRAKPGHILSTVGQCPYCNQARDPSQSG